MKTTPASYFKIPNTFLSVLYRISTALICCLLIYAAMSKLLSFNDFRVALYRQPFPHSWANALVYLLPAAEILAVILLIFPRLQALGLLFSAALLLVFTAYVLLILIGTWKHIPCSCGGMIGHISWGGHLALNLFFLTANLLALYIHLKERRRLFSKA